MKLSSGDRVAVLSPAFAAPAAGPAIHEQAMRRLTEATGLVPVEYPTTRRLDAPAADPAADVTAAFADPGIRAVLATIGGDDQITVIPHLDDAELSANPKPFLGYSDNTNLLNHLWRLGVPGFYGGSTQVHLGAGPGIDDIHLASLRAALLDGGDLELTEPGESEDYGRMWDDPRALTEHGDREATDAWTWAGPARRVTGRTWGGCLEVLDQIGIATGDGRGEQGGVHVRRAVVNQPGQAPRALRIVEVQQRILGEQFAAEFQHIVQLQGLEPARVAGRDRRGLVQVEHDVVQKKQHGRDASCDPDGRSSVHTALRPSRLRSRSRTRLSLSDRAIREFYETPTNPTARFTARARITVLKTKAVRLCTVDSRRMPRSAIWTSAVWDATPMIRAKCRKSQ